MPKVFSKNTKINVIEYGEHACLKKDVQQMTSAVIQFFKGLFSKKA